MHWKNVHVHVLQCTDFMFYVEEASCKVDGQFQNLYNLKGTCHILSKLVFYALSLIVEHNFTMIWVLGILKPYIKNFKVLYKTGMYCLNSRRHTITTYSSTKLFLKQSLFLHAVHSWPFFHAWSIGHSQCCLQRAPQVKSLIPYYLFLSKTI